MILSTLIISLFLTNNISLFDEIVYNIIYQFNGDIVTNMFLFISEVVYVFIAICFLCWIFFKNKKFSFLVSFNLGLSFVISYILKAIFRRPRPIGIALSIEYGYSMPSSHSMVSICFLGFLFYFVYKNMKNQSLKNFILIFLSIYTVMIGISRIYLGVHYASDVLLGFSLGILYLIIFVTVFKNSILKVEDKR